MNRVSTLLIANSTCHHIENLESWDEKIDQTKVCLKTLYTWLPF
jgi:hypothetical protein